MTNKPQIGPMLRLVLGVGALLSPLARPLLKRRLVKGKEDPARWREKLGETNATRPDGPLIWMHGVGVGEVMALRGLIIAMSAERPDLNFLVTSSARSSGEVFAKNLPPRTQHQYLPLDLPSPVARFLDHWKPDLVVWSDQEVWPRLAVTCARRSIPQAYVAARITEKSAKAKSQFGSAYGDLYRLLDARHAQDTATATHMKALLGDETAVSMTGSLKAAAAPLADDVNVRLALPQQRKIWVAASANLTDCDITLTAQQQMKMNGEKCPLLIIAPRVMGDVEQIEKACAEHALRFVKRSLGEMPDDTTDVFIADSFGELGIWYRAGFAALIGGSFDETQGHNPWEAVALNCAVLHGTKVGNFASDYRSLGSAEASHYVGSASELVVALGRSDLDEQVARAATVREQATLGLTKIKDDLLELIQR